MECPDSDFAVVMPGLKFRWPTTKFTSLVKPVVFATGAEVVVGVIISLTKTSRLATAIGFFTHPARAGSSLAEGKEMAITALIKDSGRPSEQAICGMNRAVEYVDSLLYAYTLLGRI